MTKRLLSVLFFLLLTLAVGCGQRSSGGEPSQKESSQTETASSWQTVLQEYPVVVELEEGIYNIYPIEGDSKGFLIFTGSNIESGNLYYCMGNTGDRTLIYQDFPASEFTAGIISPGTLQITSREGIFQWDKDGFIAEQPFPDEKRFDFSFNYAENRLFWVDSDRSDLRYGEWDTDGTVLWASTLGENTSRFPDIDEDGNQVVSRATAPVFSESGKLAFFLEISAPYEVRPVLYDLESGEYWTQEDSWESTTVCTYMIDEKGVMTCYYQGDGHGWNKIKIISLEKQEEVELDFSYIQSYSGKDCLYLEDEDGNLYRFSLRSMQSELIYQATNSKIRTNTVLGTSEFEAILLVEIGSNATASVIMPK